MKVTARISPSEMAALPLAKKIRLLRSALCELGYSIKTYNHLGSGNLLLKLAPHNIGGTNRLRLPPSVLERERERQGNYQPFQR